MTRLAVGMPVDNGMPYLPETATSLLAQTYANLELLQSEDGIQEVHASGYSELDGYDPRGRLALFAEERPAIIESIHFRPHTSTRSATA